MSGNRYFGRARCLSCALHEDLCYCEYRPAVKLPLEIVVVQHNREKHKPTNTVRSLVDVIDGIKLVRYAVRGEEFDTSLFQRPNRHYALLFPDPEALTIPAWQAGLSQLLPDQATDSVPRTDAEVSAEKITTSTDSVATLVVLDGTWAQCSRMRHRVPTVCDFTPVKLGEASRSSWGIRHTPDPSRVSTFQAVALAIGDFGYREQAAAMLDYFDEVSRRLQLMRGTLAVGHTNVSPEVYRRYLATVNTQRPERSGSGKKR